MTNSELLAALSILKKGRASLIHDITLQRKHDLLRIVFKYENDMRVISTAFDQYFIEWINTQIVESFKESTELGVVLVNLLSPILENRLQIRQQDLKNIDKMVPNLLKEKVAILKSFLVVEDITEARLNQLKYLIEKDNALFTRQLKALEEEYDGRG